MHADERAAVVALGKRFAAIESEPQSGDVGAHCVVGFNRFGYEIWPLTFFAWIFILAKVREGPAVEGAFLDAGQIIGNQIVTQKVPLVDDRPQNIVLGSQSIPTGLRSPVAKIRIPLPSGLISKIPARR